MTGPLAAGAALLAAMAAARIAELGWAARLTRRARARGATPHREPVFGAMVIVHTLPFWLVPLEVVVLHRSFHPVLFAACTAGLVVLAAARVWTLRTLGAAWNVRIVRPPQVVTTGPYRFVRHPNYAIVIAELLLLPVALGALWSALAIGVANAAVLARRIPAEERLLAGVPGWTAALGGRPRFLPALLRAARPQRELREVA